MGNDRCGLRSAILAALVLIVLAFAGCGGATTSPSVGLAALPGITGRQGAVEARPDETLNWLDGEVRYIATPIEVRVFRLLKKADEREQFITQFWQRRDPTSETPRNEYREELGRRVEYANAKYKERGPGWKTDRGRAYIVYGPPDDLRTAAMGSGGHRCEDIEPDVICSQFPHERWRYRELKAVGLKNVLLQFVDACICNEYRLLDPDQILWPQIFPENVDVSTSNQR